MIGQELISVLGEQIAFGLRLGKALRFHCSCGNFLLWHLGNTFTQGESAALSV